MGIRIKKKALVLIIVAILLLSIIFMANAEDKGKEKIDKHPDKRNDELDIIKDSKILEKDILENKYGSKEPNYKIYNDSDLTIIALETLKCEWASPKDEFRTCTALIEVNNKMNKHITFKNDGLSLETLYPINSLSFKLSETYSTKETKYYEKVSDTKIKTFTKDKKVFTNYKSFDKNGDKIKKNQWTSVEISFKDPMKIVDGAYTKNSYNLTIQDTDLSFILDPDVSACSTLSSGGTYTMTANITDAIDTCIEIGANNAIFDCAGYTIQGEDDKAIYVRFPDDVTVKNCNILLNGTDSDYGIYYHQYADNGVIDNNTVYVTDDYGIRVTTDSKNILISNNNVTFGGWYGINVQESDNNQIVNNTIYSENGLFGISATLLSNVTILNNIISVNESTIRFQDVLNSEISNNYIFSNTNEGLFMYSDSHNNYFSDNIINVTLDIGIRLLTPVENNTFLNNNITTSTSNIIVDNTLISEYNTLIYNNSYGQVSWNLLNLNITESGTVGLGNAINITNNLIIVDSTSFTGLNQSANLSFYNLETSGTLLTLRNNESCGDVCSSPTDTGIGTIYFNVSHFTNYSLGNIIEYFLINIEETNFSDTTPEYLDTIFIWTNVTLESSILENVSYEITYPNTSTDIYYNTTNSNLYNSTTFTIDQYGLYSFNVTAYNNNSEDDSIVWSENIHIGNITLTSPDEYAEVNSVGNATTLNLIVTHNATSKVEYNLSITDNEHLENASRFVWDFGDDFNITADSNYEISYNVTSTDDAPVGDYIGNITITRTYDDNTYKIPIKLSVSTTEVAKLITFPTSKSNSILTDSQITWILQVNNTGNYNATNCNLSVIGTLESYYMIGNSSFEVLANADFNINVTITANASLLETTADTMSLTCTTSAEGGTTSKQIPLSLTITDAGQEGIGGGGGGSPLLVIGGTNETNIQIVDPSNKKIIFIGKTNTNTSTVPFRIKNIGSDSDSFEYILSDDIMGNCWLEFNSEVIAGGTLGNYNGLTCFMKEDIYKGAIEIKSNHGDTEISVQVGSTLNKYITFIFTNPIYLLATILGLITLMLLAVKFIL